MDKIEEFVHGVKFLAPGIVVAIIFFMFSDVKFDQFGFLLFCAVAIILISFVTSSFLTVITYLFSVSYTAISRATAKKRAPAGSAKKIRTVVTKVRARLESMRLIAQFALSIILGVLVVNIYQQDSFYTIFRGIIHSPKISQQDTIHFVLGKVVDKKFDYIDERPGRSQICPPPVSTDCSRDVYLKVKTKQGDVYEGAMRYFPTKLEVQGLYLSPACVARIRDKLQYGALEKIAGPGVYMPIGDVAAIEYVDALSSSCFELYYPEYKKPAP